MSAIVAGKAWLSHFPVLQIVQSLHLSFEVISRAYERLSLIVTTDLPFESWVEIFGCERLTGVLLDRLTHRVHIIEANGPSYRLRQSKRRLKKSDPNSRDRDSPGSEKSGSGNA